MIATLVGIVNAFSNYCAATPAAINNKATITVKYHFGQSTFGLHGILLLSGVTVSQKSACRWRNQGFSPYPPNAVVPLHPIAACGTKSTSTRDHCPQLARIGNSSRVSRHCNRRRTGQRTTLSIARHLFHQRI